MKKENKEAITKSKIIKTYAILILLFVLVFLVTALITDTDIFLGLRNNKVTITEETPEFDYTEVLASQILTKSEKNYYVLAYEFEDNNAELIKSVISGNLDENEIKLYFMNTKNGLNQEFISENEISTISLVKIKNNKLDKIIKGPDDIKQYLGY